MIKQQARDSYLLRHLYKNGITGIAVPLLQLLAAISLLTG